MIDDEDARLQEERTAAGRVLAEQRRRDKDVVAGLLSTPAGRDWVERVLEFCNMNDASFTSTEVLLTTNGRRQVGLFLVEQFETYAAEAFIRMRRERLARLTQAAVDREMEERRERQRATAGMPLDGVTGLEDRMDEQARDYASKENP